MLAKKMNKGIFSRFRRRSRNSQNGNVLTRNRHKQVEFLLGKRPPAQPNSYCRNSAKQSDISDVKEKEEEGNTYKTPELIVNIEDQLTTEGNRDIDLTLKTLNNNETSGNITSHHENLTAQSGSVSEDNLSEAGFVELRGESPRFKRIEMICDQRGNHNDLTVMESHVLSCCVSPNSSFSTGRPSPAHSNFRESADTETVVSRSAFFGQSDVVAASECHHSNSLSSQNCGFKNLVPHSSTCLLNKKRHSSCFPNFNESCTCVSTLPRCDKTHCQHQGFPSVREIFQPSYNLFITHTADCDAHCDCVHNRQPKIIKDGIRMGRSAKRFGDGKCSRPSASCLHSEGCLDFSCAYGHTCLFSKPQNTLRVTSLCCHSNAKFRHSLAATEHERTCSEHGCGHCHSAHLKKPTGECKACTLMSNKHCLPTCHIRGNSSHSCSSITEDTNRRRSLKLVMFTITDSSGSFGTKVVELIIRLRGGIENLPLYRATSHCCESSKDTLSGRASKRHLAETQCNVLCHDCQVLCQDRKMTPSATLNLPAAQERTYCPCCHRIVPLGQERKPFSVSNERIPFKTTAHPSSDQYASDFCGTDENMIRNSVINSFQSLGHFQLSPRLYKKLVNYCQSNKILASYDTGMTWNSDCQPTVLSEKRFVDFLEDKRGKSRFPFNQYTNFTQLSHNASVYTNEGTNELCKLAQVLETVEDCPWYWGEMTSDESRSLLRDSPVGTFLLRDSSDPRYLFSLSLVSKRGPTSIRITYSDGVFRFDNDKNERQIQRRSSRMQSPNQDHRRCVISMILHYTKHLVTQNQRRTSSSGTSLQPELSSVDAILPCASASEKSREENHEKDLATKKITQSREKGFKCSFNSRSGRGEMSVVLAHPRPKEIFSLKQICRSSLSSHLKLWKNTQKIQQLPLPLPLKKYVKKYPYPV